MKMTFARAMLAAAALTLGGHALAGEAEIRKNLPERIPQAVKIDEIRKSPVPGLWEVRVNGFEIVYVDDDASFLVQGDLIDLKSRRNLSKERLDKLSEIDFDRLPLADAFKIVRGNGKRRLAVFEDPNCGYCKQFERDLLKVDNVTVHLFLYPVLGPDSLTKSRDIWCSKDKARSWNDWMLKRVKPQDGACDTAPIARNVVFGRKHNITGTPTLIFADGSRTPGAISAEEVEKRLSAAK